MIRFVPPHRLWKRPLYLKPFLDLKRVVQAPESHRLNAKHRNMPCQIDAVLDLHHTFKELSRKLQLVEEERNRIAKKMDGKFIERAKELKNDATILADQLAKVESDLYENASEIPNSIHPETPLGDPTHNKLVKTFGPVIRPGRNIMDHVELGRRLDIIDFISGTNIAGSRQYFLKGKGALLELALIQFAIQTCIKHGFQFMITPDMAYNHIVKACGFNPRNADGALPIHSVHQEESENVQGATHPKKALVGTAEIPLAGYFIDKLISAKMLPIRLVGLSHCFRPETGHHGAESRGLYRVHQFTKVEMFVLSNPEQSQEEFDRTVSIQEEILEQLGLSCRVLNMASEELGSSAYNKYDIEGWFPGRDGWGELTSASNCTDFQTRRLGIRYRDGNSKNWIFPHTLNGTACAVPRIIQAIIENMQDSSGTIQLPSCLIQFMLDGSESI